MQYYPPPPPPPPIDASTKKRKKKEKQQKRRGKRRTSVNGSQALIRSDDIVPSSASALTSFTPALIALLYELGLSARKWGQEDRGGKRGGGVARDGEGEFLGSGNS